jgi:hypothetical protein
VDRGQQDPDAQTLARLHDDLMTEYFKIADLVRDVDQRLLTIKGWGVTLSLASLGFGFQQDHYGLFLVAAVSAIAFWVVEGLTKIHQMRFYPRMGDIEVAAFELFGIDTESTGPVSSPLIDWSWYTAETRVLGGEPKGSTSRPERWPDVRTVARAHPFWFAHVMFPHVITIVVGTTLFVVGLVGGLGPI